MSEIHGAAGSYVVNALDPDELEEFEAHLAVCPTCSREVAELGETAAELSLLASVAPPPPALRKSILSAISEVTSLAVRQRDCQRSPAADAVNHPDRYPAAQLRPPPPHDDRVVNDRSLPCGT
jgi:anti-sigma factor RsiW